MTEKKKCEAIKRLLTDETIFKSKAFTTAVTPSRSFHNCSNAFALGHYAALRPMSITEHRVYVPAPCPGQRVSDHCSHVC